MEKSRARAENRKSKFPGARWPEMKKKRYNGIWDGCPQLSYILRFGRPGHKGRKITKYGGFRPFWPGTALGTRRNPGPGPKSENHDFSVLGVPKQERKVTTLSRMAVRNFLPFYVLADRTPRGRKSRNTGILGHFGPGRPLALGEITGAG